MKSPLLIVAILTIAVLSAALAAPWLIDWNAYRAQIEQRIEHLTGRKTVIAGPISVRLFPAPSLRFHDVRIHNLPGAAKQDFFTAARIKARFAIAPLLRARLDVVSVKFDQPVFHAEVLGDGAMSWTLDAGDLGASLRAARVTLQRALIRGGSVMFRDVRTGVRLEARDIDMEVSAVSLAGPLKAEGTARIGGAASRFSISYGAPAEDGSRRVAVSVLPQAGAGRELHFTARADADDRSLTGRIVWKQPRGERDSIAYEANAEIVISARGLAARDIALTTGGRNPMLAMSGSADIGFGRQLVVDAALRATRLDLDAAAQRLDLRAGAGAFADAVDAVLRRAAAGRVTLDAPRVRWRGGLVSDAGLTVKLGGRKAAITRAVARLPGDALLSLGGEYRVGSVLEPRREFRGSHVLKGTNLSRLVNWAAPAVARRLAMRRAVRPRPFVLKGLAAFSPEGLALRELTLEAGEAAASGSVRYVPGAASKLAVAITARGIDMGEAPARLARAFADLNTQSVSLDLRLAEGRFAGEGFRELACDCLMTATSADIRSVKLVLDERNMGSASGTVDWTGGAPDGFIEATIDAGDAGRVLRAIAALGVRVPGADLLVRAGELGRARLSGTIRFEGTKTPARYTGDVTGRLGDQPLAAQLSVTGAASAGRSFTLALDASGVRATLDGRLRRERQAVAFDAKAAVSSSDGGALLAALGLSRPPDPVPLELAARVTADRASIVVTGLEGAVAGSRISGEATADLSGPQPALTVKADVDRVWLQAVLGALFAKTGGALSYPAFLQHMNLDLAGRIATLVIPGTPDARALAFSLSATGEAMALTGVQAELAGGALRLSATADARDGALALAGSGSLDGADLARLLKLRTGAAPFRGLLDLQLDLRARGRTGAGLASSISGEGRFAISKGVLAGVDAAAFGAALKAAKSPEDIPALLADVLEKGDTGLDGFSGAIGVENALATIPRIAVRGAGLRATVQTFADLAKRRMDAEWRLRFADNPELPPLVVVYTGAPGALAKSIGTRDLVSFLTIRSLRRRIREFDQDPPAGGPPAGAAKPGATISPSAR